MLLFQAKRNSLALSFKSSPSPDTNLTSHLKQPDFIQSLEIRKIHPINHDRFNWNLQTEKNLAKCCYLKFAGESAVSKINIFETASGTLCIQTTPHYQQLTECDMSKIIKTVNVQDRTPVSRSFLYLMPPALQ